MRARKLVAINLHPYLFSSAAYLCLQQESMSVTALSVLLEAVAKSIRHKTAMLTVLATSKLLLENSSYELRNAPINAKTLFDKIKEVAKSNYEVQQQRFLAASSNNINVQQKSSYSGSGVFKKPRQPNKSSSLKQPKPYRS